MNIEAVYKDLKTAHKAITKAEGVIKTWISVIERHMEDQKQRKDVFLEEVMFAGHERKKVLVNPISKHFSIFKIVTGEYSVTHRPSGYRVCYTSTRKVAVWVVSELEKITQIPWEIEEPDLFIEDKSAWEATIAFCRAVEEGKTTIGIDFFRSGKRLAEKKANKQEEMRRILIGKENLFDK